MLVPLNGQRIIVGAPETGLWTVTLPRANWRKPGTLKLVLSQRDPITRKEIVSVTITRNWNYRAEAYDSW